MGGRTVHELRLPALSTCSVVSLDFTYKTSKIKLLRFQGINCRALHPKCRTCIQAMVKTLTSILNEADQLGVGVWGSGRGNDPTYALKRLFQQLGQGRKAQRETRTDRR